MSVSFDTTNMKGFPKNNAKYYIYTQCSGNAIYLFTDVVGVEVHPNWMGFPAFVEQIKGEGFSINSVRYF